MSPCFQGLRGGDLATVDPGSVRTVQIDDDGLFVLERQARVLLGYVALGQDDVVALDATHGQLGLGKIKPSPDAPLIRDHNRVHPSVHSRCGGPLRQVIADSRPSG